LFRNSTPSGLVREDTPYLNPARFGIEVRFVEIRAVSYHINIHEEGDSGVIMRRNEGKWVIVVIGKEVVCKGKEIYEKRKICSTRQNYC